MSVEIGGEAPDFALPDQTRSTVRLSDYRGRKNVVVVFYPLTFTSVCQGELCEIRDRIEDLSGDDVQTLAISCDSGPAQARWAQEQGFTFPLLSDFWPHKRTAQAYGVFDDGSGLALRGTFIVDRQGRLVWKVVNAIPDARDVEQYREVLATL